MNVALEANRPAWPVAALLALGLALATLGLFALGLAAQRSGPPPAPAVPESGNAPTVGGLEAGATVYIVDSEAAAERIRRNESDAATALQLAGIERPFYYFEVIVMEPSRPALDLAATIEALRRQVSGRPAVIEIIDYRGTEPTEISR
jgi:hypothetical protein